MPLLASNPDPHIIAAKRIQMKFSTFESLVPVTKNVGLSLPGALRTFSRAPAPAP
jgi:hypothetical protein